MYKNVLFCIKFLKNFLGRGISRPHLCLSPIPYFWIRHCYKVHLECLLGRILYSLGDELVVTGHPEGKVRYMVITVTVERTTLPRSSVSAIRVRNESRAICIVYKPTLGCSLLCWWSICLHWFFTSPASAQGVAWIRCDSWCAARCVYLFTTKWCMLVLIAFGVWALAD